MRTPVLTLALLLTLAVPAAAGDGWLTDYEQAKQRAKAEKKVILADFTGSDWCHWCKVLQKEVFDTPEFKAWAKTSLVLLEVDFPAKKQQAAALKQQNEWLRKRHKIEGYPTIVFLTADGKELGRHGYEKGGPAPWIKTAKAIIARGSAPKPAKEWLTNYKAALARAKKEKKIILADFTGSDWCGWCKKMKREVFSQPAFKSWAKENVVLLELDFPQNSPQSAALKAQNESLMKAFGIEGFPTIVFMNDRGEGVGRMGYERGGAEAWVKKAQAVLANAK